MDPALSDAELAAVQAAAAPLGPDQRGAFIAAVAAELAKHQVVGPGALSAEFAASSSGGIGGHLI
jgi:hypothetical protein